MASSPSRSASSSGVVPFRAGSPVLKSSCTSSGEFRLAKLCTAAVSPASCRRSASKLGRERLGSEELLGLLSSHQAQQNQLCYYLEYYAG